VKRTSSLLPEREKAQKEHGVSLPMGKKNWEIRFLLARQKIFGFFLGHREVSEGQVLRGPLNNIGRGAPKAGAPLTKSILKIARAKILEEPRKAAKDWQQPHTGKSFS